MIELLGHGNCGQIPHLSSYATAKLWFEKVKPLRGRTPELRPLGRNRRYTWYEIRKNTYANQAENTQYDTYACRLFNTDCVEFYPDGRVTIRNNGWRTITTGAFINFVLWQVGRVVSESGKWYFINKQGKTYRFSGDELKLKPDGEFYVLDGEPEQEAIRRLSRKAMGAMRKKYRTIIEYGKTMLALDSGIDRLDLDLAKLGFTNNNLQYRHNWAAPNAEDNRTKVFKLMDKQLESGDLELLYDLARYVATSAGHYNYRQDRIVCHPQTYVKFFDELIKHQFRDEVFVSEPVPVGVIFNDKNKKYFN